MTNPAGCVGITGGSAEPNGKNAENDGEEGNQKKAQTQHTGRHSIDQIV